MTSNGLKSYFKVTGAYQADSNPLVDWSKLELVINQNDNITDGIISKLILHLLIKDGYPIFYLAMYILDYVEQINSIAKNNYSKLRVILYRGTMFTVEKLIASDL